MTRPPDVVVEIESVAVPAGSAEPGAVAAAVAEKLEGAVEVPAAVADVVAHSIDDEVSR